MGASPIEVIKNLMGNGVMAGINQQIDFDTAAIVASEMGFEPSPEVTEAEAPTPGVAGPAWRLFYDGEDPLSLATRPPVITILGHVDHGKTSLLDRIRETNVAAGEAGGITQHIGAYQIEYKGRKITFLDTPGHEAFTAMRARGAQGADIAVLVVAADDGVMPQTREAISHAKAAGVPIIVALNKIDRDNANPDRVKQQLSDVGLVPDDWDGDTMVVPVSARTGEGLEDLVEAILLVADETDIKANPAGKTAGTILESEMDRFRGVMTTLLVQNGTLRSGDVVLAGSAHGRIKAMFNEKGGEIAEAGPSTPARAMGLNEPPEAGTLFEVVQNDKIARLLAAERATTQDESRRQRSPLSLEELYARFQAGEAKELNLIVKADVQGSLEPIVSSLGRLSVMEEGRDLKVNIIHADIGTISESDVMLASASSAIIVGFQVDVDTAARRRADSEHVEIRLYNVIYNLIDEVEQALEGLLEPVYEDKVIGAAEVRNVFKISKVGTIAGCYIREGEARRSARVRVIRNHQMIHEGAVSSLKRFQEDVRDVRTGFECGVGIDNFSDFQEGDIIQFLVRERVR
jgi:translation initiation factor IF-2